MPTRAAACPSRRTWRSTGIRPVLANLTARYAAAGETPGTAPFYVADGADAAANREQLRTALTGLLNSVLSCTVDMNALVTGNPALGTVTLGTDRMVFDDPNGWRLETNQYQVTLQGTACERFKAGASASGEAAALAISFPCEIAVPR